MKAILNFKEQKCTLVNILKRLKNLFLSLKYSLLYIFFPRQNWTTSSPTITVGYFLVPCYC